jgi:hypothetical protein
MSKTYRKPVRLEDLSAAQWRERIATYIAAQELAKLRRAAREAPLYVSPVDYESTDRFGIPTYEPVIQPTRTIHRSFGPIRASAQNDPSPDHWFKAGF